MDLKWPHHKKRNYLRWCVNCPCDNHFTNMYVSNHNITVLHVNCISVKLEKWRKKKTFMACLRTVLLLLIDTSFTGAMNYSQGSHMLVWPAQPWLWGSGCCSSPTLPPIPSVPSSGKSLAHYSHFLCTFGHTVLFLWSSPMNTSNHLRSFYHWSTS